MKRVLLMIAVVALVGCGKPKTELEATKEKAEQGDAKAQSNLGLKY